MATAGCSAVTAPSRFPRDCGGRPALGAASAKRLRDSADDGLPIEGKAPSSCLLRKQALSLSSPGEAGDISEKIPLLVKRACPATSSFRRRELRQSLDRHPGKAGCLGGPVTSGRPTHKLLYPRCLSRFSQCEVLKQAGLQRLLLLGNIAGFTSEKELRNIAVEQSRAYGFLRNIAGFPSVKL